jgi:hypothetical protein
MPATSCARRVLLAALVLAGGGMSMASVQPRPASIVSPAPAGSFAPHLTRDHRGRALLSWLETRASGGHRFRFARLDGSQWTAPVTIAEGDNFFANWADVPAMFVTGKGTMAAHWLEKRGRGAESYDIRIRTSTDEGRTWAAPVTPHRDGVENEHGFVSFFEVPNGIGLAWLDGRDAAGPARAMSIRAATLTGATLQTLGEEQLIDARVCDCCPTAATSTADGVVVAYRDRSADEVRDIAVSRFSRGVWSAPAIVHSDTWKINACPVNGPALASRGNNLVLVWPTGLSQGEVKAAFSTDGGRTFVPAIRLDNGSPVGRVNVLMLDDQRALAAWIEPNAGASRLVMRVVSRNGQLGPTQVVADVPNGRQFPRMLALDTQALFAWTQASPGAPTQVAVKIVDAP